MVLYWSIGREILDRQHALGRGDDVVGRISQQLRADTGGARGFSRLNLFYMRRFARLWSDPEKVQPLAALFCWSHHQVLLDAFKLALHRIYAPIAVSTWRTDSPPALPPVDIADEVPADLGELAQLDDVRSPSNRPQTDPSPDTRKARGSAAPLGDI